MTRLSLAIITVVVALGVGVAVAQQQTPASQAPSPQAAAKFRGFVPVTDEMLMKPSPSDWLMWRRTQDSAGFSPLTQINRANVAKMKMTWTRGLNGTGTNE